VVGVELLERSSELLRRRREGRLRVPRLEGLQLPTPDDVLNGLLIPADYSRQSLCRPGEIKLHADMKTIPKNKISKRIFLATSNATRLIDAKADAFRAREWEENGVV
jgi:hypothetical protein